MSSGAEDRDETLGLAEEPITFVERFAQSEQFRALFREGMELVEETASYLDGEGRKESRALARAAALLYASESMRLTTRLMQLASWLLLQRAVREGEISRDDAQREQQKVSLNTLMPAESDPNFDTLPEGLLALIARSLSLHRRVRRLDASLSGKLASAGEENAVRDQRSLIESAFKAR